MTNLAAGNEVGDSLTVLWEEGGQVKVAYGEMVSEVPFAIELPGEDAPAEGTEVRLVRDQGDRWVAGTGQVAGAAEGLVRFGRVAWEEPSMRVHDRTEVEWPLTMRILDDCGLRETYQIGMVTDISLGGAGIYLDDAPEVGSLVEIKAHPADSRPLRAVGVVVRRTGYSAGLSFLYLWGAQHFDAPDYAVERRAA